ncbi:MAG: methyltransferase domain-containing protein [Snowella sp.]|nr:methyltransferase domain-containing protein [Snowella sp.]
MDVQENPLDGWNADLYQDKHQFVWEYGGDLIQLLNPRPSERILDLGCGTGQLSQQIADFGAEVIGIDSSPKMIERSRANYPHLTFQVGDATNFHFDVSFDAVFSNAVLHWVKPPQAAISCIKNALKPSGRFVVELGGKGNIQSIITVLQSLLTENAARPPVDHPWYFPRIGEYASLLEEQGFRVIYAACFERPTPLEGHLGIQNWLKMFTQVWLQDYSETEKQELYQKAAEKLKPMLYRDGIWVADYVRLRIIAHL